MTDAHSTRAQGGRPADTLRQTRARELCLCDDACILFRYLIH